METRKDKWPLVFLVTVLTIALWSVISANDYFTWILETTPAFIAIAALLLSYKKFQFTNLLYSLIAMHCVVLLIGGHYTYAEVPLFNWLRDTLELSRNHYDRLGHFVQGFVPAMVARELLLRNSPLKTGKWLFFIIIFSCLGISASYELIEWVVSVNTGDGADAFLGTQGDIWDTQKDMAMAMFGAITALITLGKIHDKSLQKIKKQ